MAYSYEEAMKRINAIVGKKGDYNKAAANEPTVTGGAKVIGSQKQQIADTAQSYYDWLRKNGFDQIAGNLSNMGEDEAKTYADKLQKTLGRSKTRDYLYSLGKKYDLTPQDIDKLIEYNDTTGEVSFGGSNLGTPLAEVDGRTYYDTSKLDDAFNSYKDRAQLDIPLSRQHNKGVQDLMAHYNDLYKQSFANPYETEEGKNIMADYGAFGKQASLNQQASRAASNGGNIDSLAAQSAALANAAAVAKGHEAVGEMKNRNIANAIETLKNMGVDVARINEADLNNRKQSQSEAESDAAMKIAERESLAGTTGVISPQDLYDTNPYIDKTTGKENGQVADYKQKWDEYYYRNQQLQNIINSQDTTQEQKLAAQREQKNNMREMNWLNQARYAKIRENPEAYKNDNANLVYYSIPTADMTKTWDAYANDLAAARINGWYDTEIAKYGYDSQERINKDNNATDLAIAEKEAQSALDQIGAQSAADKELEQEKAKYNNVKSYTDTDHTEIAITAARYKALGEKMMKSGFIKTDSTKTGYVKPDESDKVKELILAVMQSPGFSNDGERYAFLFRCGVTRDELSEAMNAGSAADKSTP